MAMRVLLTSADFGQGYELTPVNKRFARQYERETGHESRLFQSDWDAPGLAENLGWNMRTAHKRNCPEVGGAAVLEAHNDAFAQSVVSRIPRAR